MKQRSSAWALCVLTALLTAAMNVAVGRVGGIDLFSITLFVAVPVGAIALGFVATSGYSISMKLFRLPAKPYELWFLMLVCVGLQLAIYLGGFLAFAHEQRSLPLTIDSFQRYLFLSITESKVSIHMKTLSKDLPPVPAKEFGWFLLIARLGALLAVAKIVQSTFDSRGNSKWTDP